jgi:ABC-type phosphonate transport system ATPase subunit
VCEPGATIHGNEPPSKGTPLQRTPHSPLLLCPIPSSASEITFPDLAPSTRRRGTTSANHDLVEAHRNERQRIPRTRPHPQEQHPHDGLRSRRTVAAAAISSRLAEPRGASERGRWRLHLGWWRPDEQVDGVTSS